MSTDFLSRVRAEALRRIEEERFEKAVIAEMKNIRLQNKPKFFVLFCAFRLFSE